MAPMDRDPEGSYRVMGCRKLNEAISLVTRYSESKVFVDLRRQALGFRGSLQQEAGNLEEAKSSFFCMGAFQGA